ncbi:DNA primase [Thiomicrorhabdus sp.]|uniref:DNA primase n=1 Tax=Thiomicrorhabdus sp. TaxID=2039724 RepID=UPI0029C85E9A|nr:DNA primase [Thiomicrorhabdus sp.]
MSMKSGSIPRNFIENLLARADLVQVINQRVPLKKAGATYKACCPFHSEKTPSFNVNPSKQFYHCFGCGASGDAIKFLMDYDGLSFVEAVESLAAQYGMEVPRERLKPEEQKKVEEQRQQQRDLYDVMHMAAKFYRHQLRDHPQSQVAKSYLKQRGLSPEIAKAFVIGYAPPGWDGLIQGLNGGRADPVLMSQLIEGGLVVDKSVDKKYDRFRNRVMFPIRDGRGRVIAFGGRVLGDDQPKYLNSPETPIFHKSSTLYGLFEMRQTRQNFDQVLVVEGYMDVVALAQYGIQNAVATLGTATTAEHLQILFRQFREVVFCFDGDSAGVKAAWKALEIALPLMHKERVVKFLFLPQGEDPDSTVRKEGVESMRQRIATARPLSSFLLEGLQGRLTFPVHSIEGRQQLVTLAEPYIRLAQGLYQFLLLEGLSELVELPIWRIERQMGLKSGFTPQQSKKPAKEPAAADKAKHAVVSVSLKILRVLSKRPHWTEMFSEAMIADLSRSELEDERLLGQSVAFLKHNRFDLGALRDWILSQGRAEAWQKVEENLLQDDEHFLLAEFESLMTALARELNYSQLGKNGWDSETLSKLQRSLQKK